MTFPADLEKLLAEHKAEENAVIRFGKGQQIECLLWNNAPAILRLVRAAETNRHWHDSGKDDDCDICQALAELNGGSK